LSEGAEAAFLFLMNKRLYKAQPQHPKKKKKKKKHSSEDWKQLLHRDKETPWLGTK
jgi:hypothetical protein